MRTVVQILLFVAQMLSDAEWREEIEHISNRITQYDPERDAVAA